MFPITTNASTTKSVKITETSPVFNDVKKVAVFQKGSKYTVADESDRFYHTVIGNSSVKFSKNKAAVVKGDLLSLKALHPVQVKTVGKVQILEKPSIKSKAIGQLLTGMTLQVQRQKGNYFPILIGGKTGYIHKNQLAIDPGIPVLMYHDIVRVKTDQNVSKLELDKFKAQMDYLKKNKWNTITPQELELWVKKKITLPKKSVLITFDDGYKSTIELAYPILKNYKFKATSFIITSRIDREYMVSESDLMSTQDIYSYQNHTDSFHMFNSLTNLSLLQSESRLQIYNDIAKSNTILESLVDHAVTSHAYPYGKYSPQALLAIKDAGITSAFTIDEGNVNQGDNLYALNRQRVHSNMSLTDFARRLEGK